LTKKSHDEFELKLLLQIIKSSLFLVLCQIRYVAFYWQDPQLLKQIIVSPFPIFILFTFQFQWFIIRTGHKVIPAMALVLIVFYLKWFLPFFIYPNIKLNSNFSSIIFMFKSSKKNSMELYASMIANVSILP
jgi:hypothetical protein